MTPRPSSRASYRPAPPPAAAAPMPALRQRSTWRTLQRFVRTPKGLLTAMFAGLLILAAPREGLSDTIPTIIAAVAIAALLDAVVQRLIRGAWALPTAGILTGAIVGFVLSAQEPLAVVLATSAIAIASKHALRVRLANVFNPAAFALVASTLLFDSGQSWWGALPDTGFAGPVLLLAAGVFIADRINKLPLVLSFFGAYFFLFTAASITGNPAGVAEVFRSPDIEMALFFAFFMLDDPPTCPVRYRDQVIFGGIVALGSFTIFVWNGAVCFLPAGLLMGNVYAAAMRLARRRPAPRTAAAQPLGAVAGR